MPPKPPIKSRLHPRNKNRERYDLGALVQLKPALAQYIKPNKHGADSVDFAHPTAVKLLNQALLHHYYGIEHWDFPDANLCPPIPGRADYLHHMADLLRDHNYGEIPTGEQIVCYDIGVGANCIYPIIGITEYGWRFVGSDIDPQAIASARQIVDANPSLQGKVELILQKDSKDILYGAIERSATIDLAICNPPFHASVEDAQKGSRRKVKNLSGKKDKQPTLNFAGVHHELIYEGGESRFIQLMVRESKKFADNCFWFSTLVSKQSNLKGIYAALDKTGPQSVKTIPMGTGNKSTRIVAWTFLTPEAQKTWRESRWKK